MQKILLLCVALALCGTVCAQSAEPKSEVTQRVAQLPEYAYCEIIANSLPVSGSKKVIFDFGQKTEAMAYNWLCNEQGEKLGFSSGIQALNYMVARGWEFVQTFATGENSDSTHYLLRIATQKLTAEEREKLLAEPKSK